MRSRFHLSGSAQEVIASLTRRHCPRLVFQMLGSFGQPLIKGRGMLCSLSLFHGTGPSFSARIKSQRGGVVGPVNDRRRAEKARRNFLQMSRLSNITFVEAACLGTIFTSMNRILIRKALNWRALMPRAMKRF